MSKIAEMEQIVAQEINRFCKKMRLAPAELRDPIIYTLTLPAKRVRPLMVLMGCDLFGGSIDKAIYAALSIELFHNFTLIHDDLMDNAPLRRNQPTVHEKWNKNVSVLSGDTMLMQSIQLLSKTKSNDLNTLINLYTNTAIQVCQGQQLDMNYEKTDKISTAQYLEMIELKTAVLLATSLKIGALIGGAKETDAQYLYDFGKNLGITFQLQDDVLDVYGDEKIVGKQRGGDIIANKKTYLLLKAIELAKGATANELNSWLTSTTAPSQEKIDAITSIYNVLSIKEMAEVEIEKYYSKAIACLEKIEVEQDNKTELRRFSDKLIRREK